MATINGGVNRRGEWLSWVVLSIVAIAAISLVGVHLPPLAKKIGLFAVAFGLLAGWAAARLAARFHLQSPSSAARCGIVFFMILAGQVGMALESHRVRNESEIRRLAADEKRSAALRLLDSAKPTGDSKTDEDLRHMRQTLAGGEERSFSGYLRYRVSDLGENAQRAAAAIWVVEIVLGSVAGTWIFRRMEVARLKPIPSTGPQS